MRLVSEAHPRHLTLVGFLQLGTNRAAGMADHTEHLPAIITKTHPVEHLSEGANPPLQPLRVG